MRRASLILTVLTFIFFWFTTFSGARSGLAWRDLSQAGVAIWVFLILGAIIILLQLIPAIILFFSFVGTGSHLGYKVVGTEKETLASKEPVEAKEQERRWCRFRRWWKRITKPY
jgi:hypothetical protein